MLAFPYLGVLRGVKRVLAFPKVFRFNPSSFTKVLPRKIEKMFFLSMVRFYPVRLCQYLYRVKAYEIRQLRRLYRQ